MSGGSEPRPSSIRQRALAGPAPSGAEPAGTRQPSTPGPQRASGGAACGGSVGCHDDARAGCARRLGARPHRARRTRPANQPDSRPPARHRQVARDAPIPSRGRPVEPDSDHSQDRVEAPDETSRSGSSCVPRKQRPQNPPRIVSIALPARGRVSGARYPGAAGARGRCVPTSARAGGTQLVRSEPTDDRSADAQCERPAQRIAASSGCDRGGARACWARSRPMSSAAASSPSASLGTGNQQDLKSRRPRRKARRPRPS